MKTLSTLLLIASTYYGFSQDFKSSVNASISYKAMYIGATNSAVITSNNYLIHENDALEVIDLTTKKIVYKWDPEGANGQTSISKDGKFACNYSQNAKLIGNRWVDQFTVLDIENKKVYSHVIEAGYWNKAVFGAEKNEVLVNKYEAGDGGKCTALLWNFVEGKAVRSYFSSTKFSTVIMAMSFSPDGTKVYVGIAENGYTSYFNVYDKKSGSLLKKVKLSYNMSDFFVTDDYIFTAGDGEDSEYTSKFSSSDYSKLDEWKMRISNVDPTGNYSIIRHYDSKMLSKVDLTTGESIEMFDVSSLGNFYLANGISEDGKYYFTSIAREGMRKEQIGTKAIQLFKNELVKEDETVEDIVYDMIENLPTEEDIWFRYTSLKLDYKIEFPVQPEDSESKTSKGRYKQNLKHSSKNFAYIVNLVELSSKVKESKYEGIAADMAEGFVKKMAPESSDMKEYVYKGQKGSECVFTKGKVYYRYRSICLNGTAYQFIYLNSEGDGNVGDRFFDSFVLGDD